jgi:uncharacterized membrane protein YcaP (DUF421 family)
MFTPYYFFADYGMIAVRLISAFAVVLIFLKVIGMKQQLKQITSLDLILNFMLGAILSGFILNENLSPAEFFAVMFIYIVLVYCVNLVTRKTTWGRRLFVGTPKVIIENGRIDEEMIDKINLSIHDLAAALRAQRVHSLGEVKMAQIEPSGDLTIVRRGGRNYPLVLIDNGVLDMDALAGIHKDQKWIIKKLAEKKIKNIGDVFFAYWYKNRLDVIRKS